MKTRSTGYLLASALTVISLSACSPASHNDLSVLVVRGGHYYDTPEFENMCLGLKGIQVDLVLTEHMEKMTAADIDQTYDAILFLNQNKYYPTSDKNRKQYMDLAELGVGMVFLQFTLSSQPEWNEYHDLVGGKWFLKNYTEDPKLHSTYFTDMTLDIKLLDRDHPVTEGLDDFTMNDAYYGNIFMDPTVHPLLGTDHLDIARVIAWTHEYAKSKVVYIMPGFTKGAYQNNSYARLMENALGFVAKRADQ
jgi:uncharacterized protein